MIDIHPPPPGRRANPPYVSEYDNSSCGNPGGSGGCDIFFCQQGQPGDVPDPGAPSSYCGGILFPLISIPCQQPNQGPGGP